MLVCLCMVYQIGIALCVSVFVYGISDRVGLSVSVFVYGISDRVGLSVSVFVYGISDRDSFVC